MKYTKHIALFALSLFVLAGIVPIDASAQTQNLIYAPAPSQACVDLMLNLRFGSDDVTTEGSVTLLQNFLVTQGDFNSAYLGTGHFGPITFSAATKFQAAQGLPTTGYVGPLTRTAIKQITCGVVATPVTLYSLSPNSGIVGNIVNLTGFGFTANNTILFDGSVVARNVPITSSIAVACTTDPTCRGGIRQTLVFTVPTSLAPNCPPGLMCPQYMRLVTPGNYAVTVQNENGTSNALTFTVTSNGSGSPVAITGLDAPSTLSLSNTGTWTVHVLAGSGIGNLHYSVLWGDEAIGMNQASIVAPTPGSTQTSATFTHAYQRTGTYTPTFTVTDDNGNSTNVSSTLTITPIY